MESISLINQIIALIKKDMIFENPKSGTSKIVSINTDKVVYIRKNSRITLCMADIVDAYGHFKGKKCSSVDLKQFKPKVFDSDNKGHGCNCTFMFTILNEIGLLENGIEGEGKAYQPYYVKIK